MATSKAGAATDLAAGAVARAMAESKRAADARAAHERTQVANAHVAEAGHWMSQQTMQQHQEQQQQQQQRPPQPPPAQRPPQRQPQQQGKPTTQRAAQRAISSDASPAGPREGQPRKSAAHMPPRPPSDKEVPSYSAAYKEMRRGSSRDGRGASADRRSEKPARRAKREEPTTQVDDDGTVRCTVGFFGMGGLLDDDDDDNEAETDGYDDYADREQTPQSSQRGPSSQTPPRTPLTQYSQRAVARAPRAYSQPPPTRVSPAASRGASPSPSAGRFSPGAASNHSEPAPASRPTPPMPRKKSWKQKEISVQSTEYYLNLAKAARAENKGSAENKGAGSIQDPKHAGAGGADAWSEGPMGYAKQMRQRASDVEAIQRREEGARMERGYAMMQRVQQRQAPSRSTSTDSVL
eukprot:gnl/TRDRNA2_/TRDRNA2_91451_c1_seq1.p1 gnl/TRDRNA2_/TRDRNA2_91451_c1~~gnl/TRDRNA2_/TRDRNA2_91451_c1_seq1.p1  ORF type:complete len:469 (-),score=112.33 gnl/TRDRNA2_/TRDRNA2_91451_c1_seq1:67-1290(-)